MKLSVVATLYKSAPYIDEFVRRASVSAKGFAGEDYEIILVNDGSPDDSVGKAVALLENGDGHLVIVDLSRNFGHHKAIMTGLAQAGGEYVFLIDSDLEEEPEWLAPFAEEMRETGCDVVYGVQQARKGRWFERRSGGFFYRFFNRVTKLDIPENLVTARLMKRRYVEALLLFTERELFLAGIWHIVGFDQRRMAVLKHSSSETTYSFRMKVSILVNAVTSFSNAPLIFLFNAGALVTAAAVAYTIYLVLKRFAIDAPLEGWTSIMAAVLLLGGLNLMFLGGVGLYVSKIFSEVKNRPYTIIRDVYRKREA
ncbi:MAG: glycosyltransferase family 2 protein [Clostridiales Family XIII bacterium]|jgi:putative glycosyltransferase|nr:glycosyltransferase family 2 protein [Clostridiales Family XIII bacterium]